MRALEQSDVGALTAGVLAGDVRSVARALTLVENDAPEARALLRTLFSHPGHALIVGVTGPAGVGKSTLVDRLVAGLRREGRTVGVVAVDPSSPYSGGAILGDRIRMQTHTLDPGVFIRSMATRGHLGGLAAATDDVLAVLSASGRDVLLVETVGVGQDEVDVVGAADVSVVVLVPGLGDDVQALKAGLMEIADVFVVNKADRDGAAHVVDEIQSLQALAAAGTARPEIVTTVAIRDEGTTALLEAIAACRTEAEASGRLAHKRRARVERQFERALRERLWRSVHERCLSPGEREQILERLLRREQDPLGAADEVLARMGL